MSVRLYLSLCCGWTATVVSEEEGIYALRFHCWCLESLKSCLLLLMALPGLIDTLAQLKVPAIIESPCYDCLWRGNKATWHRVISSAQHCWPNLWHYIYCFVQYDAFIVEENTYTNTHTRMHALWCHLLAISCHDISTAENTEEESSTCLTNLEMKEKRGATNSVESCKLK